MSQQLREIIFSSTLHPTYHFLIFCLLPNCLEAEVPESTSKGCLDLGEL